MKISRILSAPVAPTLLPDGSCPRCLGGWVCAYHSAEGLRHDRERSASLRRAVAGYRANAIARVCARLELESDEFYTREAKAELILAANPNF